MSAVPVTGRYTVEDLDLARLRRETPNVELIVEVASPSTRAIDRSRKRADYLLGGAEAYWMLDRPGPRTGRRTGTHRRGGEGKEKESGPLTGRPELSPRPSR